MVDWQTIITFEPFQKNDYFKVKIEEKPPEKHLILKNYGNLIILFLKPLEEALLLEENSTAFSY